MKYKEASSDDVRVLAFLLALSIISVTLGNLYIVYAIKNQTCVIAAANNLPMEGCE